MNLKYYLFMLLPVVILSCNKQQSRSGMILTVDASQTMAQYKKHIGSWFDKDVECYGVALIKIDSLMRLGVPIKCKILSFSPSGIKCMTTEDFKPFIDYGCEKAGTKVGDVWIETNSELFATRQEAAAYIKSHYIAF